MSSLRTPTRILVVEDNLGLRRTLRHSLTRRGHAVVEAATGADALRLARDHRPDLVLLDLVLPDADGLEVCRTLRREMATPILVLTALDPEVGRAASLAAGADGYMTIPFSMDDLCARIDALLARDRPAADAAGGVTVAPEPPAGPPMDVGGLELDPITRTARWAGAVVRMSPKEFDLLSLLVAQPGAVATREHIAHRVWGGEITSNTISVHVRWLREKFESLDPPPFRIVAVFGVGYRLEPHD